SPSRHLAVLACFGCRKSRAERARRAHALAREILALAAARRRRAALPAGRLFGRVEHARVADRSERLPGVGHRAIAHGVDPADLEGVETEPFGGHVEHGFSGELGLQRAEG